MLFILSYICIGLIQTNPGMKADYGKNPGNPLQLNSIVASRLFLNTLVNAAGYHIVYHRLGSLPCRDDRPVIDHYEIMTSDNHYDDLFINIYNETNSWIPPDGYLFEDNLDSQLMICQNMKRAKSMRMK